MHLVKKSKDPTRAIKEKLKAKMSELFIRHKGDDDSCILTTQSD